MLIAKVIYKILLRINKEQILTLKLMVINIFYLIITKLIIIYLSIKK